MEHAKLFYQHIGTNPLGHVDSFYPFELGTTEENLTSAIAGEMEEYDVLYNEAEMIAKEEGFDSIADTFHHVRHAEEHHARRYKALLDVLKEGTILIKILKYLGFAENAAMWLLVSLLRDIVLTVIILKRIFKFYVKNTKNRGVFLLYLSGIL